MAKGKKRKLVDIQVLGRQGGKARAANLTPQQRSEAARKAANARWLKKRKTEE
jgi:hypothetical protein